MVERADVQGPLLDVLVEFAHTLVTEYSVDTILDRLSVRICEILPVTGAGMMLEDGSGYLRFVSASDDVVRHIESLQVEFGEGPCVEAYRTGEQVVVPDLRCDERFPRFSSQARRQGLAAVFSFPMRLGDQRIGAFNVYRDRPGDFDAPEVAAGQTLADVATAYIINARGRVESQRLQEQLRYRALHDSLTDLPNRTLLHDRIAHAVARSGREDTTVAVLFVDLDRFKDVNDDFGHHIGDRVLVAVTQRLRQILRPDDTLARFGGDEFVVLCEALTEPRDAAIVAERVAEEITRPVPVDGRDIRIAASIGIAVATGQNVLPETLLRQADAAMYRAKQSGGHRYDFADEGA